jgi:methylmalonyl-CoA/ethylmalonyl-CoA epimerase
MFNLDHIGIVVADLDSAVATYCGMLGLDPASVEYHDVPSEGVRVAMLRGNTIVELLQPTNPEGGLAKYLEKRGPGLHHLCYSAPKPLEAKLAELKAAGVAVLDDVPRTGADGRVFFVHPKSVGGVLTEFVERD